MANGLFFLPLGAGYSTLWVYCICPLPVGKVPGQAVIFRERRKMCYVYRSRA